MKIKFCDELIDTDAIVRITPVETVEGSTGLIAKFAIFIQNEPKPIYARHFLRGLNKKETEAAIKDLEKMRNEISNLWVGGIKIPTVEYAVKDKPKE